MLLCKRKWQGRFISFIVRKDSMGSSSPLQDWLNPLCAGCAALRCGLWRGKPREINPSTGHVSLRRYREHWGGSQESRWPLQPCLLFAVQPWTCHIIHQMISRPHHVTGIQKPRALLDTWGFSDGRGHSRLLEQLKQRLEGSETQ